MIEASTYNSRRDTPITAGARRANCYLSIFIRIAREGEGRRKKLAGREGGETERERERKGH